MASSVDEARDLLDRLAVLRDMHWQPESVEVSPDGDPVISIDFGADVLETSSHTPYYWEQPTGDDKFVNIEGSGGILVAETLPTREIVPVETGFNCIHEIVAFLYPEDNARVNFYFGKRRLTGPFPIVAWDADDEDSDAYKVLY